MHGLRKWQISEGYDRILSRLNCFSRLALTSKKVKATRRDTQGASKTPQACVIIARLYVEPDMSLTTLTFLTRAYFLRMILKLASYRSYFFNFEIQQYLSSCRGLVAKFRIFD